MRLSTAVSIGIVLFLLAVGLVFYFIGKSAGKDEVIDRLADESRPTMETVQPPSYLVVPPPAGSVAPYPTVVPNAYATTTPAKPIFDINEPIPPPQPSYTPYYP